MTISAFPTPTPARTQTQEVFSPAMDAFLAAFPTFVTEANALGAQVSEGAQAVDDALPAFAAAVAAANYKGPWSSLSGALAIPASVIHSGRAWVLISGVADVAASEPGVSADWLPFQNIGTAADIRAGTSEKLVIADTIYTANAPVVTSGSGSFALDLNAGRVFQRTLTGNSTLANPTNQKAGQSGVIYIIQDATGGRTLSFGANWKALDASIVITTAANKVNVLSYYVRSSGNISLSYLGAEV